MKEKNIKTIITGFTQQNGYFLEEIISKNNNLNMWTVSKDIGGESYRLIFMMSLSLHQLIQYDIPDDKNNIYILFSNDEINKEEVSKEIAINNLLEKSLIRVNVLEKKVNYSGNVNSQVVQDLASVMNNTNLHSDSEKTSARDRPWVTMVIIAINVMMYIVTAYLSYVYAKGSIFNSDIKILILLGAKVNGLIARGQYFRLISCMFLHGGLVHLGVNMYSLYAIGAMVERVYGKIKYIAIYFVSGICASMLSYIFSTSVSIGASGAIFGLLGAVLIFAIKSKGKTGNDFIRSILSVIFINIFIGVTLPNIDNFGHIGGLLGGIITSFLISFRAEI
ncbi:rhomboid family intramembrane serine protease [Clostridium sp. CF011]|uniref:rhomboid family intramembrane serine protease n=1 Tax=unclassified Clostridium TaxID=2614128 RepID=UPI001C0AD9D9|nr:MULTISPECIES: rhomboid family intramembrane serine protease [unclassified Clostridium]MBU3091845.1 rhomboid family intramembrane serine protease [Clostridium sp. CF011]MBW9145369.1 rhomboid family intramembrane serine protease [Clostridium sp. CM027]UVE42507.1 rhomboid family intramembrane serine protease [Clostridium sp. CM027]WAG68256.1 rhomboid family intramembrane serine protease [Clostridium sp. CF011]